MLTDTSLKIENTLSNKRTLKRQLLNERAEEKKTSKGLLKKQFNMWLKSKKDAASINDRGSDDEGITKLQEEFFEEMMEIDNSIATTKERQNYIEGEINKMEQEKEDCIE